MTANTRPSGPDDELVATVTAEAAAWSAVVSGLVSAQIVGSVDPSGRLTSALHYDFGGDRGFVVARHELAFAMPEAWELRLCVRHRAPSNTLEIKFVDAAGSSVWRWSDEAPPSSALTPTDQEWSELRIPSRDFRFAWGPAGGGSIENVGAVEVAVVAVSGGRGCLEFTNLRVLDRTPGRGLVVVADSFLPGHEAGCVLDGHSATSWQSTPGGGPHTFHLSFDGLREVGGLVLTWDPRAIPSSLRVEGSGDAATWMVLHDTVLGGTARSFLELSAAPVLAMRLVMHARGGGDGVGIIALSVKPPEWSRTPTDFLTSVALDSPRGDWPRYLRREQTTWTPVASPESGPVGLLSDDACVEVGEGGFSLEPSLWITGADVPSYAAPSDAARSDAARLDAIAELRWQTWADSSRSVRLEEAPLPVATASRYGDGLSMEVTAVVEDNDPLEDVLLVRYRLADTGGKRRPITLLVALRPLQVTPPWQTFRNLGGPSPIDRLVWADGVVRVNDAVTVTPQLGTPQLGTPQLGTPQPGTSTPQTAAARFGAARFDHGGVAFRLSRGTLPPSTSVEDESGRAEGVLAFDVSLEPGAVVEVFVECRLARARARRTLDRSVATEGGAAQRMAAALDAWRLALPRPLFHSGAGGVAEASGSAVTALAHILACRDGAALQPGPRRYTRSWIRDGAIIVAALLRAGSTNAARDFVDWYAPFQREDGYVPCCVDRDGVDDLVEHDSHGQFVFAVAELFRFTRNLDVVRSHWPRCARAMAYVEALRETRRTPAFRQGPLRACYALLPQSVSHEGYLAQPVHSYWDDFWALRGLLDAAFLADALGLEVESQRWAAAAVDLSSAIGASTAAVMEDRGLSTLPSSVEWADFDPTAVAGTISLVGAGRLHDAEALEKTFDEYMRGWRERRRGAIAWDNYTPYEVRIVGALVRMGRRDDANELLDFLLGDRRPPAWRQWPEITWRDEAAPGHVGDLPHCWIGAEYAISLRTMFAYEREIDQVLVLGAGLRREWLDADGGLQVSAMPTWYGDLDYSIRRDAAGGYDVRVGGCARPPGGFLVLLPDGEERVLDMNAGR